MADAIAILEPMLERGLRPAHRGVSLTGILPDPPEPDALYEGFVGWAEHQGLSLYPHQDEAVIELFSGNNVILATPTG